MPQSHSNRELFDACVTLFGPHIPRSIDFLRYLRRSGVKAAFRKRAMETHPDCIQATPVNSGTNHDRFVRVSQAYKLLDAAFVGNRLDLIEDVQHPDSRRPSEDGSRSSQAGHMNPSLHQGPLPRRALRLGQFLYYSRAINWDDLIQALLWQQRQRPRIGEIARGWNMLSREAVKMVLVKKKQRERFGEAALRMGWLTPYEIMALLGKQRLMNQSFGRYFIDNGLLTSHQIERFVRQQRAHNRRFRYADCR